MLGKVKIAFVLPERLRRDLRERMIQDGYSLKAKSQWVSEAVERLVSSDGYVDLVKVNDEMQCFEIMESVLVEKNLKTKLDNSVIEVRKKYPAIDGVQSRIMRTAILQRLL